MEVHFRSRLLQRCFEQSKEAAKKWGPDVGRRYISRINTLYDTDNFESLGTITTLHFHELDGDRKGQWALTLVGRWRLIVVHDDDGGVTVREVTNHYGD